jgi:hypothetical protein
MRSSAVARLEELMQKRHQLEKEAEDKTKA